MRCGGVVPAAGRASRFGDGDKTLRPLAGVPLLEWTIRALIESQVLGEIVIVVSEANQFPVLELITSLRAPIPISTVRGGELRMESVEAGVRSLDESTELVLIHDAARPLVSSELVRATVSAAAEHGAAIPGVPAVDTIKRIAADQVVETLDRSDLIAVQTPQVFRQDWLISAYAAFPETTEATDEASIVEAAGYPVRVVPGEPTNFKVTTSNDAILAEILIESGGQRT